MAVHRAGFRPLLFNEFAKRACETLEANGAQRLPDGQKPTRAPGPDEKVPLVAGDVQELDMDYLAGQVDVLAGGPPCQPFSLGGVAKGDEDKRNMFPQMFKAVQQIQPKAVICENVRGLLRPSFRRYFDYIQRELELPFEERGDRTWEQHYEYLLERREKEPDDPKKRYDIVMMPVNAADYGVPQIRNRVIIVAFRRDLNVDFELFKELVKPTHSESALHRSMEDGSYWERHVDVPTHVREWVMARLPKTMPMDDGLLPGTPCVTRSPASATTSPCRMCRTSGWTAPSTSSAGSRNTSAGPVPGSTTGTPPTNSTARRRLSRPAFTVCPAASRSCSWTSWWPTRPLRVASGTSTGT
ncbi:DNA cytosine methyltransferase [Streptomyces diastatochromogenes]|nr:DNA cytosine methyltransferase [Streptomyces diastatochromogenes]